MPAEARHIQTRLIAIVIGFCVAAACVAALFLALPAQATHSADKNYGYLYSGAKSASTAFLRATATSDTLYVFGSSEFSTPVRLVEEMPSQVFGATNYGLQLSLVGEAYDQSLWHTIALGALASQEIPFGKVALIVSPVWFVDGGLDADTFNARFSYALYSEFCQNPQIPDPVKSYVRDRLEAQGVDEAHLYAAESTLPHDMVNNAIFSAIDDIHLRQDLASIRSRGISLVSDDPLEQPDFVSLREQALVDASKHVSTNDWGLEDAFYTRQLAPVLGSIENYRADETYSQTPEYDDLACFLDVAQSCGLQVMVIISPVHGDYYDYIGISQDTRVSCYEHIKTVCEEHGATVADFSSREYEKYFLYDIVHFGWTGWVDIEEALWNFAKEV